MKKFLLSALTLPLLVTGLTACDPPLVPPNPDPDEPAHPFLDQYTADPDDVPPPPPPITGSRN